MSPDLVFERTTANQEERHVGTTGRNTRGDLEPVSGAVSGNATPPTVPTTRCLSGIFSSARSRLDRAPLRL